jgi:hypothetical protein
MNVPELKKSTGATVAVVPQWGMDGAVLAVVLIKEAFAVDRRGRVVPTHDAVIHRTDVPWEEDAPATSSVRFPCDVCVNKPATDVVVVGHAMAAYATRQTTLDVTVEVGPLRRVVRVFGPRVWYRGALGFVLSDPTPFESVPVRWELAWGGADFSDPSRPVEEARNPVGRGVVADPATLEHQPGPQVEDPENLIATHRTAPAPAGLAAIGRHYHPRRTFAGTADELWLRERMPLPPADFDDRFHQVAAPGLTAPGRLRGGEAVLVHNMGAQGPLAFELPRLTFFAGMKRRGELIERPPALDTVTLLPNDRRVEMTWRAVFTLPRHLREVEFLQVHEKARLA